MSTNIREIAKEAQVSVTTVSRVLRKKGDIAPQTRERVLAVAKRLHYRPNLLVQGMQTGRTRSIGVIIDVADPFLARILVGVQARLVRSEYVPIVIRNGKFDQEGRRLPPTEFDQLHSLVDRRVDGVILRATEDSASDEYLREVWNHNLPLVAVDRQLPRSRADFAGSEDFGGGREAARRLLALGHRRFGQISGFLFSSTGRDRRDGFLAGLAECPEASCDTREDPTFGGSTWSSPAVEHARALLSARPRPTAIFCGNDLIAVQVCRVAAELGLSVPADLSVVGFCHLPFSDYLTPQLSTVEQDPEAIGEAAADLILRRLDGELDGAGAQHVRVPTKWLGRGTTAPPPPSERP